MTKQSRHAIMSKYACKRVSPKAYKGIRKEMETMEIKDEILEYLTTEHNTGISSETLAFTALKGVPTGPSSWEPGYPYDNSDFHRCVLFKNQCPNAFEEAKKILTPYCKTWKGYFENWEYMEKIMWEQWRKERDGQELYDLMKSIQNAKA